MDLSSALRRRWPVLLIVLVAVPIAAWSAFWLYARLRAADEMDAAMRASADGPVKLACAERTFGGYPFRLDINCRDTTLVVPGDRGPVTLHLPRLTLAASLFDRYEQAIDLQGPLTARDAQGSASANWSVMQVGVRGLAPDFDSISLHGEGFTLTCDGCAEFLRGSQVGAMDLLAQRRGDTTDFTFSAGLVGVRTTALSRVTASDQPATLAANGVITQFELPTSLRFVGDMERWRRDGGQISLENATLDQAAMHVVFAGHFGLDAAHRPAGTFDVTARNAAPLVSLFTGSLSPILQLAIGAALRGLTDATTRGGDGAEMKLSGAVENGALSFGPLRGVFSVPPLY